MPGAHRSADGTTFVAWSSVAERVQVLIEEGRPGEGGRLEAMEPIGDGFFRRHVAGVVDGARYSFVLDGDRVPDPFARYLPDGVHASAEVVATRKTAPLATPPAAHAWILYELHVGTFSPEGTYRGVIDRLDHLVALGVTAIELLPLAAFPGERGWGYDGVALFAPFAGYGTPDDLRALIDAAHQRGLAMVLDVVYNHFGPAGNYLSKYGPEYFTQDASTPWGAAPDHARAPMRSLAVENARYWLEDFGFDGLRLDATHAIVDGSVLKEITALAHAMTPPRKVFFEDERNDRKVIDELGADGFWADDFHHQVHVLLTGERDGYYAAYQPTLEALARTIRQGIRYTGEPYAPWKDEPRGRPLGDLPLERLVYCTQNHDQVGNRALGTRLSRDADLDAFVAASALLLFLPMTPLLFMGQEWAASTPFLFFSDHEGELGRQVTEGRRSEFAGFSGFADPEKVPDPQARSTFEASILNWSERRSAPHEHVLAVHRALLQLRRSDAVLSRAAGAGDLDVEVMGEVLTVTRRHGQSERRLSVALGPGAVELAPPEGFTVVMSAPRFRISARDAALADPSSSPAPS